jgi:hypothetical protein
MDRRTYSELIKIPRYEDRFEYLKLDGTVGADTFGWDRYLNQQFYRSPEWRRIRDQVIVRDLGCDLAHQDYSIQGRIYIHHMNPVTSEDILNRDDYLLNPEYLVCVSQKTHNAIHYGNADLLPKPIIERSAGDTKLW